MATNTLAPVGLMYGRQRSANSPTYQANQYTIQKGYGTKIGYGDVVGLNSSGYVILAADGATSILGVFQGCLPYFDTNFQQTVFTQWWTGTANPSGDVGCLVADDYNTRYIAQVSGSAFAQSWVGMNIGWTATTNGAPNISGISALSLNGSSVATTPTLPFRITGFAQSPFYATDPTATNPWIEVAINTSQNLNSTGI